MYAPFLWANSSIFSTMNLQDCLLQLMASSLASAAGASDCALLDCSLGLPGGLDPRDTALDALTFAGAAVQGRALAVTLLHFVQQIWV